MKLGFDIDGVTFDIMSPLMEMFGEKIGRKIPINDITQFAVEKSLNLTPHESALFSIVLDFFLSNGGNVRPYDGAILFMQSYFKRTNQTLVFITGRPSRHQQSTHDLVAKFLSPGTPFRIHHTHSTNKYAYVVSEGIDIFVEDRRKTALDLANRGVKVLLMNRPWNRDIEHHSNINHVNNWFDVGIQYTLAEREEKS